MSSFVLDSSVTLSWFMPDERANLEILDRVVIEGAIAPSIWGLEIANVLLCAERAQDVLPQPNVVQQFIL